MCDSNLVKSPPSANSHTWECLGPEYHIGCFLWNSLVMAWEHFSNPDQQVITENDHCLNTIWYSYVKELVLKEKTSNGDSS